MTYQGTARSGSHPSGIANILSLARVRDHGFQVTYDSTAGNKFHLTKPDGTVRIFKQSVRGLFYFDSDDDVTWCDTPPNGSW